MQYGNFISELTSGSHPVAEGYLTPYIDHLQKLSAGEVVDLPELPPLQMSIFDYDGALAKEENDKAAGVAVIPIRGFMSRYGSWWHYGTEAYADMLNECWETAAIKSVVLRMDTPGSTTRAINPMVEALLKKNKPVYAFVDDMCMSGGEFIAGYCDETIASHRMAELGSIGVMAKLWNNKEALKQYGYKEIIVIPPESKWKNKAYLEAEDGKTQLLKDEKLSPWAVNFQQVMRTNYPGLKEDEYEGLLEGREFYAFDAIKNGLASKIMSFDDVIEYALSKSNKKELENMFNN